jgi:uncharacterized protein (TIGR02466 family)
MFLEMFPVLVYVEKVENNDLVKDLCMPFVETEYEKQPSTFPDSWDADVFTTFDKELDFNWTPVFEHYSPILRKFGNSLGLEKSDIDIANVWFNAYKKSQSQEIHEHLPGQFSAVHYLEYDPEVHTPTIFMNPYGKASVPHMPKMGGSIENVPGMWMSQQYINVTGGDLLIFPSFLEHKVPRQTTDKMRVTVSFNFNFIG